MFGRVLLCALAACHSPRGPDLTVEVKASAAAFDRAQLTGDREAMARFLTDDFVLVRGSGAVVGRDDFIAGFTKPGLVFEPTVTITNPLFVPLGRDAAIVGGDAVIRGTANGEPFAERIRYADVFVRRGGRWRVVYVQVTPLP